MVVSDIFLIRMFKVNAHYFVGLGKIYGSKTWMEASLVGELFPLVMFLLLNEKIFLIKKL